MKFIRWVLWSRARLTATLTGSLVALLLLSGTIATMAPGPDPAAAEAAQADEDRRRDLTEFTAPDDGAPVYGGTPEQQVAGVTEGFLSTLREHDGGGITWIEDLRGYATSELVTRMYGIDPTTLPTRKPRQVTVESVTDTNALVRVEFKKFAAFVSLEPTPAGWRVNAVDAADGHRDQ